MQTYLTAIEAAWYTGLSEKTIRRMLLDGRITDAIKTASNTWAIPLATLQTLKASMSGVARDYTNVPLVDYAPISLEPSETTYSASGGISALDDESHIPSSTKRRDVTTKGHAVRSADDMFFWNGQKSMKGRGKFFARHGCSANWAEEWEDCPTSSGAAIRYCQERHKETARQLKVCDPPLAGCECRAILIG